MSTTMAKDFLTRIGLGNIINMLCIIFACGVFYGKINTTVDEFKMLRGGDIARIEKVESAQDALKERITNVEKQNIEFRVDLQYIKNGIDELKRAVTGKNVAVK